MGVMLSMRLVCICDKPLLLQKSASTGNQDAVNKVYNVAVGENFSVNYLFNACRKYLDSEAQPVYRQPRAGDIRNSLADISAANQLLGYQPVRRFEEGLTDTIEYFRKRYS